MLSTKLKEAAGNSADATLYVDDVFSVYLYTGNGSTQTITNGIDLAGKGGMVWIKQRSNVGFFVDHVLSNTAQGVNTVRSSNLTDDPGSGAVLSAFNSNGFGVVASDFSNKIAGTYASWTFRKAAKFFDVVTYTGTGSARTIAHSLGVAPGMVIVKRTDASANWQVYHRSLTSAAYSIQLNLTDAEASAPTVWNSTAPTSSVFSVGTDATVNASGGTYVAYLFANDTSSTGIIQCGSYTSTYPNKPSINLGWEPQFVLIKAATQTGSGAGPTGWVMFDNMRGVPTGGNDATLYSNTSGAEVTNTPYIDFNATGFTVDPNGNGYNDVNYPAGNTYIYMAIRMPNKPPTTGTQVFSPIKTLSGAQTTGFPVDMQILSDLDSANANLNHTIVDRLRGVSSTTTQQGTYLLTSATSAELNTYPYMSKQWGNTGFNVPDNFGGTNSVYYSFKRAPGFFDEVCYTGTGVDRTVNHNLTIAPELIIVKARSSSGNYWKTYFGNITTALFLNTNDAAIAAGGTWVNTTPTSTVFSVGGSFGDVNGNGKTYVAYLFATLAGISKVGSYTGNGTGQAIACGFSAGARFVLIKRTDATGDWYTFDSARGLTSGSSPYLLLNSTAAEVTGNNGVYASTGGFTLGATAITTTNIATATYIFLAVA